MQVKTLGSSGQTERISDALSDTVERLKGQLDELDELREGLRAEIKSAAKLIPSLTEEKERLQGDIAANRERIDDIDKMIPRLEKQKAELKEYLREKQEEISEIDSRIEFLSRTEGIRS